jgi:hypothetical protein
LSLKRKKKTEKLLPIFITQLTSLGVIREKKEITVLETGNKSRPYVLKRLKVKSVKE